MSKYALNLADDGRVLSVTYPQYAAADTVTVDSLPDGDVTEYRYVDGAFVHEPLPVMATAEQPTETDKLAAQVAYTAMMTDTLLSEGV